MSKLVPVVKGSTIAVQKYRMPILNRSYLTAPTLISVGPETDFKNA